MENNEFFKDYTSFVTFQADRYGKSTLFQNEHILVGLNCLLPSQEMKKHAHDIQCRFYLILEGHGSVWVGDEQQETEKGMVVWVPSGHTHRIINTGIESMVMLVGISPSKAD
jgi:quercetin dioxygenase-like cupin family protein